MTTLSSKTFTLESYIGHKVVFVVEYTPDFKIMGEPTGDPSIGGVDVTEVDDGIGDGGRLQNELAKCIEDDLLNGDLPDIFNQLR